MEGIVEGIVEDVMVMEQQSSSRASRGRNHPVRGAVCDTSCDLQPQMLDTLQLQSLFLCAGIFGLQLLECLRSEAPECRWLVGVTPSAVCPVSSH